jgi:hypothetical protein
MAEEQAGCAHLRVSWRTKEVVAKPASSGQSVTYWTEGWWECDSGCGTMFQPLPKPDLAAGPTFRRS